MLLILIYYINISDNIMWFRFIKVINGILITLIMIIIYSLIIIPIGILLRLFRKDILNQNINKSSKSYWVEKKKIFNSIKN